MKPGDWIVLGTTLGVLVTALPTMAQETQRAGGEGPRRIEPVTVTATKIESPVAQVTAAVTVISGEEIESKHYGTVEDVLRTVPGVDIQRSGSLGKTVSARIRGANATQIQVLVDGARVKSPTSGDFNFSDISVDLIERIEIVRGPQSTLYGSDAIGGVINIITRRGAGPPRASLSVEGGNHSTQRERFSLSGAWKRLDYSFFASSFESGGQFNNDDSDQRAFGGQLGLSLPLDTRLSLSGRYVKSTTDLPIDASTPRVLFDPDSQQQTEFRTATLALEHRPVAWWQHRLALHGMWSNLGFQDAPNPSTTQRTFTRSQIDLTRREVEWVHAFRPVSWNTLTVGAEHRHEEGSNVGLTSRFDKRILTTSAFVQDEVSVARRLVLNGGARYDENSAFGDELTPRGGVALLIGETGTRLRGGYGEGFRAPTLNELFFPGFGNPDLQPERSRSWEAGVDQRAGADRVRLGVTYFQNRFRDLIQFVPVGSGLLRPENVARARTEGVEVSGEVDALSWLVLSAGYTFTDTEDESTSLPLRRFPRHRWSFGATAEPLRGLSVFAQGHVVSSQFEGVGVPRNGGYVRFDVGADYRVVERQGAWPALNAFVRVDNLFDARYSEVKGFQALGATVTAGLRVSY